jgi:deoxyribonuclease-4
MLKLGSHVGMSGKEKFLASVKEAISYNANAFMVYTGAPQNTRRSPIESLNIDAAHKLMEEVGIPKENVIVHAPYIMNLANPEAEKREFAISFLTEEIKRTEAMGANQIVLHPGAHLKQGPEVGLQHIVNGLKVVLENTKDSKVRIALETMAGKGSECGRTFEEIAFIINEVNSDRLTVCFDTCHTNDAGYDLSDFDTVIDEFDKLIGKDKISVFHINDSKNPLGAAKDRHENLGVGHIGFDTLINVIYHPDFLNVPKILETPYVSTDEESKDRVYPPYKFELEMIRNKQFDENLLDNVRKQ